ncbi:MAG TPA: DUF6152 family protein [Terriglobia bacterium]|nr:DUF6152 family protein [Terriglobia bacterium]
MRYGFFVLASIAAVALLIVAPLMAHQELAAKFDTSKTVTMKGVVTKYDWSNPQVHVFINVADSSANKVSNWAVELESIVELQKGGYSKDSLKPGDAVSVTGNPARDGSRQVWSTSFTLSSTGKKMFDVPTGIQQPKYAAAAGATPRWPDRQPKLGPATPTETGYWAAPSQTSLMQTGVNVKTDEWGLLANIADADKVAPFQPWARDLYVYRQKNFLKDDPAYQYCIPPGGPRQFQMRYGAQFAEDREHKRIFVLIGSVDRNYRIIYLDGRDQKGQTRGDADNPLYYGRAVGKWEGDTLVVDTKGFLERFWFSNGGLPHTDQLHLVERYTRTDANTLKYEVTIDDPGAYTKSWTSSWTLKWFPSEELPINFCQDNRP